MENINVLLCLMFLFVGLMVGMLIVLIPYQILLKKAMALLDEVNTEWKNTIKFSEDLMKIIKQKENKIEVVPSPRIDWCGACKKEHGYDCPLDKVAPDTNDPSQFPAEGSDMR